MKIFIKYLLLIIILLVLSFFVYVKKVRIYHLEHNIQNSRDYINQSILHSGINLHVYKNIILGDSRSLKLDVQNSVNLSVGGQTLKLLIKKISLLDFPDGSNIIINIGINDILFGSSIGDIKYDFEKLTEILKNKTNESTFYFIELLPIDDSGFFFQKDQVNSKVKSVNYFLKKNKKLKFNDYKYISLEKLSKSFSYFNDGIHLNLKGNKLFTSLVEDFINE